MSALLRHDSTLGVRRVAGVDEAGRGCLAGPIVAAAVCLDFAQLTPAALADLATLDDSKRLSRTVRAGLVGMVLRHAYQVVVVSASARSIDADGLHRTNLRIMCDCLAALDPVPDIAFVDGFSLGPDAPPHHPVVKGDATSAAIAAASVIAKETRDRLMRGPMATAYPGYGFEGHVGYITAAHTAAVRRLGPSPIHRRSFRSSAYGDGLTLFE
ncbi:MAG: ribonuclease HII [Thermoleophilia bacterium]|nr:ribonuclease HII [Thermoleophilia bacterium]